MVLSLRKRKTRKKIKNGGGGETRQVGRPPRPRGCSKSSLMGRDATPRGRAAASSAALVAVTHGMKIKSRKINGYQVGPTSRGVFNIGCFGILANFLRDMYTPQK